MKTGGKATGMKVRVSKDLSVTLRPWKRSDKEALVKYANNKKIAENLRDAFPHPYNDKDAMRFLEKAMGEDPHIVMFAVDRQGEAIGSIGGMLQNDVYSKNMEFGYWIAEPYWGLGIASAVIKKFISHIWLSYDVRRIYAEPYSINIPSRKALERAGFTLEAVFRQNVFKNGRYLDSCIYSMLREDTMQNRSGGSRKLRYIAFLRGINVGGKKVIKMADLDNIFTGAGYESVRTFIQSGNVLFDAEPDDIFRMQSAVEKILEQNLGYKVNAILFPHHEMLAMHESNPFSEYEISKKIKLYVSLLSKEPSVDLALPVCSPKKDLELIGAEGRKVFVISREINGSFGFPNNFVEDVTGIISTTRNWNTIGRILIE